VPQDCEVLHMGIDNYNDDIEFLVLGLEYHLLIIWVTLFLISSYV